ncbi:MAG: helix-turn-helix domain-containing protein [Thermomicrobiales bacterium]
MSASAPTQPLKAIQAASVCPLYHRAVELIGRRWTGAILSAMLSGASRFTDIVNAVPGLSDRLLSERLKELETEGIVTRVVHPETPVRIEYLLTDKGHALSAVVEAVECWASRWIEADVTRDADHDAGCPE